MEKDQTKCYRTINGQHYVNLCDVMSENEQATVIKVKSLRLRHRLIKHPDGFYRLFVHADEVRVAAS